MSIRSLFFCLSLMGIISCSTMNTKFSCDMTAGDKCLNVSEVDSMSDRGHTLEDMEAHDAALSASTSNMPVAMTLSKASQQEAYPRTSENVKRVWLAPYKDRAGQYHTSNYVYVSLDPKIQILPDPSLSMESVK